MTVADLEYVENGENPYWFALISYEGLECHLYVSADESGPAEKQFANIENFLSRKDRYLVEARDWLRSNLRNKRLLDDSFHLGAIFIHPEEFDFEVHVAGSIREKRFPFSKEHFFEAIISIEDERLTMKLQN